MIIVKKLNNCQMEELWKHQNSSSKPKNICEECDQEHNGHSICRDDEHLAEIRQS